MRRGLLGIPVVVAVVAAAFTGGAPAAPGEGGPACTNIVGETHNFPTSTTGTYTLNMQVQLAAPACIGRISYQLFVVTDTGTSEATLTGFSPEGYPQYTFASGDSTICVYATTSSKSGHVYDRAPNADATPDCLELTAGTPGGGSGFG
jgi:hypothetical protein